MQSRCSGNRSPQYGKGTLGDFMPIPPAVGLYLSDNYGTEVALSWPRAIAKVALTADEMAKERSGSPD